MLGNVRSMHLRSSQERIQTVAVAWILHLIEANRYRAPVLGVSALPPGDVAVFNQNAGAGRTRPVPASKGVCGPPVHPENESGSPAMVCGEGTAAAAGKAKAVATPSHSTATIRKRAIIPIID